MNQGHVATPSMPGARFTVIEAKIALGALETLLDRPTKTGRAGEFGERCALGGEDQIVGLLVGFLAVAPHQKPALEAVFGQPRQRAIRAQS